MSLKTSSWQANVDAGLFFHDTQLKMVVIEEDKMKDY